MVVTSENIKKKKWGKDLGHLLLRVSWPLVKLGYLKKKPIQIRSSRWPHSALWGFDNFEMANLTVNLFSEWQVRKLFSQAMNQDNSQSLKKALQITLHHN